MTAKTPFLPLFFGDFLAATAEWTGEERSLYLLLLGYQWTLGSLPADPAKVRHVAQWDAKLFARCWPTVCEKFEERAGRLYNPRLEEHRDRSNELAEKNSAAGRKGAAARWRKDGERHGGVNGHDIAAPSVGQCDGNDATHSNPSYPSKEKNPPTPRKRGAGARAETTIPEDFTLDADLDAYVRKTIPDADAPAMFEDFRTKARAKGWKHSNWRAAFQTYVRNCRPGSGHWASGQYPRAGGLIQWQ